MQAVRAVQGDLQSPGVVLLLVSFQMAWCNHMWTPDVGAVYSSLRVLLLSGCWCCEAVPCLQQVPHSAGGLAWATSVCPVCRAPTDAPRF